MMVCFIFILYYFYTLYYILVLFSGKTRSTSLCNISDSRNPTKPCRFPTWIPENQYHHVCRQGLIPEIRGRWACFLLRFLESGVLWGVAQRHQPDGR